MRVFAPVLRVCFHTVHATNYEKREAAAIAKMLASKFAPAPPKNARLANLWRLRNQHELDAVVEELSALLPKEQLYQLYEQATREPYSFLFVYYLKPRNEMFYKRFEERFALEREADESGAQLPGPEAVR